MKKIHTLHPNQQIWARHFLNVYMFIYSFHIWIYLSFIQHKDYEINVQYAYYSSKFK